ncbi:MAG: hypothetical protein ACE5NP_04890 [Anaerolineae bacterium]
MHTDIERPVLADLMRVLPPAMMVSSIISAITGVVLAGMMRGWSLNWVLASGWGLAILVGFVGTAVALFVGFGLLPPLTIRLEKLSRSIEGRAPTPDESRQLQQLTASGTALARINTVLLIIVVIAMAVARFV